MVRQQASASVAIPAPETVGLTPGTATVHRDYSSQAGIQAY